MSNKALYFGGAVALDILSTAGTIIVKHYRQKRALNESIKKLEQQLVDVQKEIEQLWLLQDKKKLRQSARSQNYDSSDSSDSEFYEFSDNEDISNTVSLGQPRHIPSPQTLKQLDEKLNTHDITTIKHVLDQLTDLSCDYPKNHELLWRIAEAHQLLSMAVSNETIKRQHIDKGIEACELALNLAPNSANAQKWYALLIGARVNFQPLREKIKDAKLFKNEFDKAFDLNPNDALLHYVLGRYVYEVANMSWYERKAVSLIFGTPPSGSFEEALEYCLKAEQLMEGEFKENKLTIAKCQIALGKHEDATDSLTRATRYCFDSLDMTVNEEVNALCKKYCSYG